MLWCLLYPGLGCRMERHETTGLAMWRNLLPSLTRATSLSAKRSAAMTLWKITDKGPAPVKETKFKDEKLLEEHLEDWIDERPQLLGEPLLIFGRQVQIPDTKDRLDLLAVDPHGMIVVVELKRGYIKDPG